MDHGGLDKGVALAYLVMNHGGSLLIHMNQKVQQKTMRPAQALARGKGRRLAGGDRRGVRFEMNPEKEHIMRNAGAQIARRNGKPMVKIIPSLSAAANDETPGCKLRELADDYESGRVKGVIITYVMDDGEVKYKLMGALEQKNNLGKALTIVGELKRRLELHIFCR